MIIALLVAQEETELPENDAAQLRLVMLEQIHAIFAAIAYIGTFIVVTAVGALFGVPVSRINLAKTETEVKIVK